MTQMDSIHPLKDQPRWEMPQGSFRTGLHIYNSLTKTKNELIPIDGNQLKFYICGPTVYDSSHLGHARTYLGFDIIRRIMEEYFGYNVQMCMNITDIDDKIILKSRRLYLFNQYFENAKLSQINSTTPTLIIIDLLEALDENMNHLQAKLDQIVMEIETSIRNVKEAMPEKMFIENKYQSIKVIQKEMHDFWDRYVLNTREMKHEDQLNRKEVKHEDQLDANVIEDEAHDVYYEHGSFDQWEKLIDAIEKNKDILGEYLDRRHCHELDVDLLNTICREHTQRYEKEFLEDMVKLGIKMPDVLTRVSEYIPEIIEMCEKIIERGFGYESQSSVYFDTIAFSRDECHHYAKLVPILTTSATTQLLNEGEGSLTSSKSEKKFHHDFALWKKSKPGEPAWPSPWGMGRPGWHIECSAMASQIFGDKIDIHAGGSDLKFPHHDNELAQSEAYFDCQQWVNYFMHTGHLHIDQLKMSKSLKNFITIQDILDQHPPHHLRFLFLLQPWDHVMNYQRESPMSHVLSREKTLNEFFLRVKQLAGDLRMVGRVDEHWDTIDMKLQSSIASKQQSIHQSLCDNLDTPSVMQSLFELVKECNTYMERNERKKGFLLEKAARFVTRILRIFGVIEGNQPYGFDQPRNQNNIQSDWHDQEMINDKVRPYVHALVTFRKKVREEIKKSPSFQPSILQLTDEIRDYVMPDLGVKIMDDGEFDYLFVDRQLLAKEREEKEKMEMQQLKMKMEAVRSRKQKDLERYQLHSKSPWEHIKSQFNVEVTQYEVIPEMDEMGQKISISKIKEITKQFKKQKDNYTKFISRIENEPDLIQQLINDIKSLDVQLKSIQI